MTNANMDRSPRAAVDDPKSDRLPAPMSIEAARLRWRCRRGMHELDAVLQAYLSQEYGSLSEFDKSLFAAILDLPDPELYAYLAGRSQAPSPDFARIIAGIRKSLHPQP